MELVASRLTKHYKNKIAVDRVSLHLKPGVYGLLGGNGAGKTTLMRMLCGVMLPTSGEVAFDGIDVSAEEYRDALGYLPQDFGYYPEFTGQEFLLYMACLKGLAKERAKAKAAELMETVALSDNAKKKIKTYSGGMRQRLGIAQALLNNPRILILDEPTAGLDPKERIRFRNMISGFGAERIVLLSTHIVSDIESIAGCVLLMKDGQIIEQGSVAQILASIEGKVYECVANSSEAERLSDLYPITNIRQEGDNALVRLIADAPPVAGAAPVTATLEDLYLYHFKGMK